MAYDLDNLKVKYIDVRTPKEYAAGHILGAVNIPLFTDEAHAIVGTLYKHEGEAAAKMKGMAFVGERLSEIYQLFLDVEKQAKAEEKEILIYCARGGMRSGSLESLLTSLGHEVNRLEGGYKAYRQEVLTALEEAIASKKWVVVHGMTGCGKTKILYELKAAGHDMVDIEGICHHRGSMLGRVGLTEQPTQKNFEHLLLNAIRMAKNEWVFIEAESKRLGRNTLSDSLMTAMANGKHINVEADLAFRMENLAKEYVTSEENLTEIGVILNGFRKSLGNKPVDELQSALKRGELENVAAYLVAHYYDPKYKHASMHVNYDKTFKIESVKEAANAISMWLREVNGLG